MTKVLLLGVSLTLCSGAQIPGPFELPPEFHRFRYPQAFVADCSLPLPAHRTRSVRRYVAGEMTIQVSNLLRVEGADTGGVSWAMEIEIRHGGCGLWRADLDRNGKVDLIVVTSDATSGGESIVTLVMVDNRGRPVPWQAVGHYDFHDAGLSNLVDLNEDGRAELLFLYVDGIDRGEGSGTSLARYEIRDAYLKRVNGPFAGQQFPRIRPRGARLAKEPDLTNDIDPRGEPSTIATLIPGRRENCRVQLPLTRDQDGGLRITRDNAEPLSQACFDKLTLTDGRILGFPELTVIDRSQGRDVGIVDVARLIVEVKMRRLGVQFAGRVCDSACRPFFMLATDPR
mgnify:CR=1 FL=1